MRLGAYDLLSLLLGLACNVRRPGNALPGVRCSAKVFLGLCSRWCMLVQECSRLLPAEQIKEEYKKDKQRRKNEKQKTDNKRNNTQKQRNEEHIEKERKKVEQTKTENKHD